MEIKIKLKHPNKNWDTIHNTTQITPNDKPIASGFDLDYYETITMDDNYDNKSN